MIEHPILTYVDHNTVIVHLDKIKEFIDVQDVFELIRIAQSCLNIVALCLICIACIVYILHNKRRS